jgi:hypothetical protein
MATTTPNFGWAVPTSTDLVKDGAVAIETLGDAIDASLVDLKGGTSGQVLKKNSNTDMDFVWSADSAGMTNPMTTTGDTIYSSSGSTPARLGIGSTGQVLTVASGVPSWATPAGGTPTFKGCSLYNSAYQSIASATPTVATFDSENFDTDGYHSTSTNTGRITIPTGLGGKYLVIINMRWAANATGVRIAYLRKNGSSVGDFIVNQGNAQDSAWSRSAILNLTAGDYIYFDAYQESGGSLNYDGRGFGYDAFSCQYLGA